MTVSELTDTHSTVQNQPSEFGREATLTNHRSRVLMIGPGPNVHGGINSVITAYQQSKTWQDQPFDWLSTYDDRGPAWKVIAAIRAYILGPALIHKADIVHVHGVFRKSLIRKLPLILMAKAMQKHVIFHVHAATFEKALDGPKAALVRWTLGSVDKVIALSPIWAAQIHAQCPKADVVALSNPVKIVEANSKQVKKKDPRILFLGKLENRKGFRDLLMALPAVLLSVPAAKLVFAGDGDLEGAKKLASELGISNSVLFLGFIGGARKAAELQSAAVLCLPSYDEGVPIALLEGMSKGIPVVATPVGGVPDLIRSGENGLLVSSGDVGALGRAIVSLLTNMELSKKIGNAGYAHVRRFHDVDYVCSLLHEIYEAVINKKAAANTSLSGITEAKCSPD